MCGIAGVVRIGDDQVRREQLEQMIAAIRYRGPDECGVHLEADGAVGLAHARLSIIDLSSGQQPMTNEDGSLWITFNGELFNYIELRAGLIRGGRRFLTQSDTEVIMQMYEAYGEDCVSHFNGDWAFAIWDRRQRKLFASRDRAGVRPLFYALTPKAVVFASEVKAVLASGAIGASIDVESLDQIFTFWCTLAPRTFFKGVHELPPGHSMVVRDGRLRRWAYWRPDFAETAAPINEDDAAERLQQLLADATRIRLRSDVPVGAYLSGGLDSSVVTALVNRFSDARMRTFSVAFDNAEFDESEYQRQVVAALSTEHQTIRCGYADICRVFPEVVRHAETPLLRTAPAPLYLLSALVRDASFKVVLTGEGADEFLGGYDIFKEAKIRRFWGRQPASQWRPLLLRRLYPYLPQMQAQSDAYRRKFFHVGGADLASPFFSHLPRWDLTAKIKAFFSDDVRGQLATADVYSALREQLPPAFPSWADFGRAQFLEASVLLPGYILSSQGDRMAMAHSVEGRFPFLDHRVIEFGNRLPARLKMKVLDEKYILKRALGHLLPEAVRRRPKQPYRAPDATSFVDAVGGKARGEYVEDLFSVASLKRSGLFNPAAARKLYEKAIKGQLIGARDNMAFVGILSTELLVRQFIEPFGVPS
jgi:asparagine synthase (glutamine-hydrolysing)